MNSQYMKVNPNELVIDLPIDRAKVTELMESIKAYGLLQSPNIWLKEMRIIDGFHRVVACQCLGLPEIDCIVTECDEEAFWDARIIAARPHATISNQRLAVWVLDSWKSSQWYRTIDRNLVQDTIDRLVHVHIHSENPEIIALAESIWGASEEAFAWFDEKAKKWGVDPWKILESLGFGYIAKNRKGYSSEGDLIGAVNDIVGLSVVEATAVGFQTKPILKRFDTIEEGAKITAQWIEDARQGAKGSLFDRVKQDQEERWQAELMERKQAREKEEARLNEFSKTPAGQAELRKQNLARLDRKIDAIFDSLEALEIAEFPESLRRLTSLIVAIENKMVDAFPDRMVKSKANPILLENIKLQEQIKEQQRKIESLERALNSKQATTKGLPEAAALSSSEIELMAN